jgi:hypothetical protein
LKNFLALLFVVVLATVNASQCCYAEVSLAEQLLSNELTATLTEGSAVALGASEATFLGIFTAAKTNKSKGGIILLHDANSHADWPDAISPLRRQLTSYGWHTLSIQLPVPSRYPRGDDSAQWESLEQEIQRRIRAAIQFCRSKRIFNLVLLGHQFGAVAASRFVAQQGGDNTITALVTLNLYTPIHRAWNEPESLPTMTTNFKIAFLDIVPSQSSKYILQLAANRKIAMGKLDHDKYRQIHIIGADYTFRGAERTLSSRIQAWLARLAPSMEVQLAPTTNQPMDAVNQR